DSFTYSYYDGKNQLEHIDDIVQPANYKADIDDQNPGNYIYDQSGNLAGDIQENLKITWNAYGKVSQVYDADTKQYIYFFYDPNGNRLEKKVQAFKQPVISTFYIRDAEG